MTCSANQAAQLSGKSGQYSQKLKNTAIDGGSCITTICQLRMSRHFLVLNDDLIDGQHVEVIAPPFSVLQCRLPNSHKNVWQIASPSVPLITTVFPSQCDG